MRKINIVQSPTEPTGPTTTTADERKKPETIQYLEISIDVYLLMNTQTTDMQAKR